MHEQLIYEINGKRYVIIEYVTVEGKHEKRNRAVKSLGLIFQGVAKIDRGGLLSNAYIIERFFLPEENFAMWAEYDN